MADAHQHPELILMGTGTSVGVPVVGCRCAVCTSENERNHRSRSGVLVRAPGGEFVIDTGPELRLQLLKQGSEMIRAALFTHAHADHIMGLDDLRIFGFRLQRQLQEAADRTREQQVTDPAVPAMSPNGAAVKNSQDIDARIPLFCESDVEASIRQVFHYAFTDPSTLSHRFAAPKLKFERVTPLEEFSLLGLRVLPLRLNHGQLPVLGFRIGNVAFLTDVSTIPAVTREHLQGLDTLVIDALRYDPHPTHLSVPQALQWIQRLKPRRAYLTHMSHDLDYDQLRNELPEGIEPAYDGLRIPLAGT